MHSLMNVKIRAVTKALSTSITFIGFSPVWTLSDEWDVNAKSLFTLFTFIGFLSSMYSWWVWSFALLLKECKASHIHDKYRVSIFMTSTGFLPYMGPLMNAKIWAVTKVLPTVVTFIRLLSCMHSLMNLKIWALDKALTTVITFIGLLSCVN